MTRRNLSGLLVLIALVSGFGLHGPAAAASPCQRSLDYLADRYAAERSDDAREVAVADTAETRAGVEMGRVKYGRHRRRPS